MDGSGWIPPEGYDPVNRDWYKTAIDAGGEIAIVSPYLDAQTGEIVLTFAKRLTYKGKKTDSSTPDVVCLDVLANHIQDITEKISVAGKGYGMVLDQHGFIVAHKDRDKRGGKLSDIFDNRIIGFAEGRFDTVLDGKPCTLFAHAIMEKWVVLIAVNNDELLEELCRSRNRKFGDTLRILILLGSSEVFYERMWLGGKFTCEIDAVELGFLSIEDDVTSLFMGDASETPEEV